MDNILSCGEKDGLYGIKDVIEKYGEKKFTGKCETDFEGHTFSVLNVIQLSDGRLISCSYDNTLRLWSLDGECERVFRGHTSDMNNVIQLFDGKIVSCSYDKTLIK